MASNSVSLLANDIMIEKMMSFYGAVPTAPEEAILFSVKSVDTRITCYRKTHNGLRKVLFQGSDAEYEASIWGYVPEPKKKKEEGRVSKFVDESIGSDEVGTGDFFGPVCVCAAYVNPDIEKLLQFLGVTDSKKMTDERIRQIAPTLLAEVPYSQLSLPNDKYNEVVASGLNMNAIKAKMHNRCLLNLKAKYPGAKPFMDQFAEPRLYYSYLKSEEEVLHDITFSTKGELAFPSVAAGSVLARYSFLRKMDSLSKQYGLDIPFGAGADVDEFALKFVEQFGLDELKKITKQNFANFKRILSLIN